MFCVLVTHSSLLSAGQAANIPKDLRPQMWPDFMDKVSDTILKQERWLTRD